MTAITARLDGAEILPDGSIQVRLMKVFVDAAGRETPLGLHRTVVTPLTDAAAQLDAVDMSLSADGAGAVPAADRAVVLGLAAVLHTEERRAAYAAAQAAAARP